MLRTLWGPTDWLNEQTNDRPTYLSNERKNKRTNVRTNERTNDRPTDRRSRLLVEPHSYQTIHHHHHLFVFELICLLLSFFDSVVSSAMKCFHEIKKEISVQCQHDGADEYQRNYIQPLVDQTRDVVMSKCTMSAPYEQYFNAAAAPAVERRHLREAYRICTAAFALFLARWRHRL